MRLYLAKKMLSIPAIGKISPNYERDLLLSKFFHCYLLYESR